MPCSVTGDIELIIRCERKMIRTYVVAYAVIGVTALALAFYLLAHPAQDTLAEKLVLPGVTSVVIPFLLQHVKRKNALTPLLVMFTRGQRCAPDDAECQKLKSWVDEELQRRLGSGNSQ